MAEIRDDLRYTREHEWASLGEDGLVTIGINDYAQAAMGDIVMVELPESGDTVSAGEEFGSVESPKSVSDLFAPLGGEITAVNEALEDAPELVNESCYEDGWIVKMRPGDAGEFLSLMDAATYRTYLETQK